MTGTLKMIGSDPPAKLGEIRCAEWNYTQEEGTHGWSVFRGSDGLYSINPRLSGGFAQYTTLEAAVEAIDADEAAE
jgi:hypothetical protein